MNLFACTGNLGKDCRTGNAGGTAVVNFPIAVKSGWGDKEVTLWFDCALWGKQAESKLVDYLVKGQQVAVTGEMGEREHEGKMYKTLRLHSCDLIGGKQEPQAQPQQQAQQTQPQAQAQPQQDDFDDIPF